MKSKDKLAGYKQTLAELILMSPLLVFMATLFYSSLPESVTGSERPVLNHPISSSSGLDMVMQGKSSMEITSDYQIKRRTEWNRRNYEFIICDRNKDRMLNSEEAAMYHSLPIFNYRFR